MKPRLLDLCCKAGGAAVGYHRAGFEVVGVDIEPRASPTSSRAMELPRLWRLLLSGWRTEMTHTHTHVLLHGWAETDMLAKDEHPKMSGMPRDGDECAFPHCDEPLRAGERAFAVIEIPREQRIRDAGEAWVGETHELHRIWRDASGIGEEG